MKKALPATLMLAACASAPVDRSSTGECHADRIGDLIGQPATSALGAEALRWSGATRLRWLHPGEIVTMEYSAGRLNAHLDADNKIVRFNCG